MNFLFFYKYDPKYNFDHWFHLDLVYHFRKAGYKCFAYGPYLEKKYFNINLISYSPSILMKDLYKIFKFDVAILLTKSRMFFEYRPPLIKPFAPEKRKGSWLPRDFVKWKGPKIIIDEDYHYEKDNSWYKEVGLNIIFQRHKTNYLKCISNNPKVKCFWLPFSVDEQIFKSDGRKRINKIGLVASVVKGIYPGRKFLMDKLTPLGIMSSQGGLRKIEEKYLENLKTYVSHGNCSSIYNITSAKMFEIMSSGSVLFTDDIPENGMYELFDKGSYVTYKKDGSDIIQKAQMIINNPIKTQEIAKKGRECILKKHTHAIRIKEMVDILKKEL